MSEVERIQDQLSRAYRGGAWHGPSLREILEGIDASAASARPIAAAHTIRELVLHVIAWEEEAIARLEGKGGADLPEDEDWPEDAASWERLLAELDRVHEALMGAIGNLSDDRLDDAVPGSSGTVYRLLHGVIQHNLYHTGQIAILKKAF